MKQLPMTPALSAMIKKAVGEDVDTEGLAVFETIALNTRPLPGKRGSLFENATISPITLKEMVDSIEAGNHLPLIADHELMGAPKGRFFHAALDYEADTGLTMRGLFYLDATEANLIAKLNSGSLDEVSVAFLSREFNCSECGWDYFKFGGSENIWERTCANGHKIGQNGVHGEMVGLNQFVELSLVARGAAEKPKIVGKSQSKLAPANLQLLAANGFETDELVVQASIGKKKEDTMSDTAITGLTAQLTTLSAEKGQLTAELGLAKTQLTERDASIATLTTQLSERDATIATLNTQVAELSARPEAAVATEHTEAVAFLQEQLNHLRVAKGEAKLEGDALPGKVAELKAEIAKLTDNLTSILPVGGRSNAAGSPEKAELALNTAAFTVRK